MKSNKSRQEEICLGTHGEDYGSWMSNPVFYMAGGLLTLSAVLAVLSFAVFHIAAPGVLFSVAATALLVLLIWITWIRKQYAFGGGGMMERVHKVVLSHLNFDGQGRLLEVGCGSVLNPGTVIGRNSNIYPLSSVRGVVPANSIYKKQGEVAEKRAD